MACGTHWQPPAGLRSLLASVCPKPSTFAFSPVYLQQPVGGGRGEDGRNFLCAQLLFWLLAAIDGHAKNFSLFVLQGGRYRMTPLYDVLSA